MSIISQPFTLPCGITLKNRLIKSSMSDSLGDGRGQPTDLQARLYERWAEGGVAASFIGEVQAVPTHPEKPGNLVLNNQIDVEKFENLTQKAKVNDAQIWAQLSHAGALSFEPVSEPAGPSSLDIEGLTCRALSIEEVKALPKHYAAAAKRAQEVGFSGVEIHAGHGFLLSQFLSPLFNKREDDYGGSIENNCRIVVEIIIAIRAAVGPKFPIALRINSSDGLKGGFSVEQSLETLSILDQTSLDLIDISGGTYFPGAKAASDQQSGAIYFRDYAKQARDYTKIPLMITGGFKKCQQVIDILEEGIVDFVALGRAMIMDVGLANNWISLKPVDPTFPRFVETVPGGVTAWFTMRILANAMDQEEAFDLSLSDAVNQYEQRDADKIPLWLAQFRS